MSDLLHEWMRQHQRLKNFWQASRALNLTPQEQYAYQHHLTNLGLGGVPHNDGSLSSYLATTVGFGDKTYLLPTVWDNKIVGVDEAIRRAREAGLSRWPAYDSPQAAKSRYDAIHGYMERDTERRLNANPIQQPSGATHVRPMEGPQSTEPRK